MLTESIALGLVFGFIFFECTGLVAGGLIAPGYLALYLQDPWTVGSCLLTALLTYGAVRLLSCCTLLYGRRRFLVCVLLAFFLQWVIVGTVMQTDFARGSMDLVGYVIPGLLANEMQRQGVGVTLAALLVLSAAVWLAMRILAWC